MSLLQVARIRSRCPRCNALGYFIRDQIVKNKDARTLKKLYGFNGETLYPRHLCISSSVRKQSTSNQQSTSHQLPDLVACDYARCYSTNKSEPPDESTSSGNTKPSQIRADKQDADQNKQVTSQESSPEENVSIFKRFKSTYKEYGKLLIGVHVATSCVWCGSFFYAVAIGVDVVPLLESLGAGETIIKPFQSGLGNFAGAYLLYKVATPARYTVTILGTQLSARKLRDWGYMKPIPEGDKIRELMSEGKDKMKDKYSDIKEEVKELREDMKDKAGELKDEMKDKIKDIKVKSKKR